MGAVGSVGVGAADFGSSGLAGVTGSAIFTHEMLVGDEGRGCGIESFAFRGGRYVADEPTGAEEIGLFRALEEVALAAVGGLTDAGGFEVRVGRSEPQWWSGLSDGGVASRARCSEGGMGDDGWRPGIRATGGADWSWSE